VGIDCLEGKSLYHAELKQIYSSESLRHSCSSKVVYPTAVLSCTHLKIPGDSWADLSDRRSIADDSIPFANAPLCDQAIRDIGIGPGKGFGRISGWTAENQHRTVDWVSHGAAQHQFAAFMGRARQFEMQLTKLRPFFNVVAADFIEKNVMHRCAPHPCSELASLFCSGSLLQYNRVNGDKR